MLRDLLMALAAAINHRVRKEVTLSKAVISRLRESLSAWRGQTSPYHELDSLAGSWARDEADAFDLALREQRTVDPNAWR
jgi:hypothetical protein